VLLLLVFATGCNKAIKNTKPLQEPASKRSWVFFNYQILRAEKAAKTKSFEGQTLRIFTWTNSFPSNVLKEFMSRSDAAVSVRLYDTNEELYNRLAAGEQFDIVMPAGFLVTRLIEENKLMPLDHVHLLNITNIDHLFQKNIFDPSQKFAVPYLWSTAGIAFNFAHLDHTPHHWGDLLDPPADHVAELTNRISLLSDPVRAFAAALIHLGYSPNSHSTNELNAAAKFLHTQMAKLHVQLLGGNVVDALADQRILMAQVYSSEASRAQSLNHHIHFQLPEDGAWMTVYHLAIPAGRSAAQKELAEAFINYLLRADVAAKVVNFSHRATTLESAKSFVNPEIKLGPSYARPTNLFFQEFDRGADRYKARLWEEVTNGLTTATAR